LHKTAHVKNFIDSIYIRALFTHPGFIMASPAQCFYCFETLAASYKDEEPPSLAAIESSYWNYIQSKQLAAVEDKTWAPSYLI
jgi:hypothetical protein